MSKIASIVKELKKYYPPDEFAKLNDRNPFKTLVSCILSLRTKDEVTYKATRRLYKIATTPQKILKLPTKKLEKLIYPVGFYKTKAKRIKGICKKLIKEYNCKVPDTIEELLKFKGVGRKTANIVITFGFGKHGIAVDTNVNRISNRLGLVKTKNPHETEFALRKLLPKKYWIVFNELLVRHGQNTCKPISPFCSKCCIRKCCKRVGVTRSR